LLSSWHATSNVALMPAAVGGEAVVPTVRWGWLSSTTIMASMRPLARRDHLALEREVASLSDSLSQREGWEEAATEWISTMAMELQIKNGGRNQKQQLTPLPGTPNVKMILRHFHQCCYRSSPLWFFCW
jgi:hypothetical protein